MGYSDRSSISFAAPAALRSAPAAWLVLLLLLSAAPAAAETTRLTRDGKLKFAPVFQGEDRVVFAVHDVPNQVVLKRLNLADGTQERLHPNVAAHQHDPAYSRDGRFHAFAMSANSPQLVLVIQDVRSGGEAVFRPVDARAVARSPSFSPDGARLAFCLSDAGGQQIATVDARGEDLQRLAVSAGVNAAPAFSPDGGRIAFSSSRDGDFDLYVMDADGGNVQRLLASPGIDTRPAWSPDGTRIAFTSNRDGNYEVYCLEADGSNLRRLTENPTKDDFPAWHPDGRRLLFVSQTAGKSDLVLIDVEDPK